MLLPIPQVGADIRGSQVETMKWNSPWHPDLVYECVRDRFSHWVPVSVRWDKSHGNTPAALAALSSLLHSNALSHTDLMQAVGDAQSAILQSQGNTAAAAASADPSIRHPALSLPFEELYAQIMQVS